MCAEECVPAHAAASAAVLREVSRIPLLAQRGAGRLISIRSSVLVTPLPSLWRPVLARRSHVS